MRAAKGMESLYQHAPRCSYKNIRDLLSIVRLLFLMCSCCSCLSAQLPAAHRLTVAVTLSPTVTNIVRLQWIPSPDAASYLILYGTNAGTWTHSNSIPKGTNYDLVLVRPRKSQWWITMKSVDAFGRTSIECNIVYYLPPPPPPFNAVELYWSAPRTVTVLSSPDLYSWSAVTNFTGTNAIFDKRSLPTFYRVQSVAPAITVKIRGTYK